MSIEIKNVTKNFGNFAALRNISLHIPCGELVSLLGPSGSGKTTLLRLIAGLELPDSGTIMLHGQDVTGHHVRERRVGFVFQHYALFKNMTVFENVAFGLKVRPRDQRPSKTEIRDRVLRLLKLVQIEWLAGHFPAQLSGGQRQRVALARSLAVEPEVLLLDEPFGALDAKVRKELRKWLRRLHDEIHITSVFVTHDQEEALEVSDQVVVMNKGTIEQVGTPDHVYNNPANPFVFQFLGDVNFFHTRLHKGRARIGNIEIESPAHSSANDQPTLAYIRPHDVEITKKLNGEPGIEARVLRITSRGSIIAVELDNVTSGEQIDVELGRERFLELDLREGETVYALLRNPRFFAGAGI